MIESEQVLLARYCAERDAEAFREIVNAHRDMVYAACRRVLVNDADAEDAAQDCFVHFVRKADSLKPPLGAWLHRVAVYVSIDLLRQRQARRAREAKAIRREADSPNPRWEDLKSDVDAALNALPDAERAPLVLYYLEGRGQEEIAAALGLSVSGVCRRLKRGVGLLQAQLRKAGWTVSIAGLGAMLTADAAEAAPAGLTVALGKLALAGPAGQTVTPLTGIDAALAAGKGLSTAAWTTAAGILVAAMITGYFLLQQPPAPPPPPPVIEAARMPAPAEAPPAEPPPPLPAPVAEPLPPQRVIVVDVRRPWRLRDDGRAEMKWAEWFMQDVLADRVRFTIHDTEKKVQWDLDLDAPVDVSEYPMAVVTYRALNQDRPWRDGMSLRADGGGASKRILRGTQLEVDGQVHESRFDMRGGAPRLLHQLRMHLRSGSESPAVFDLLQVRFEALPNAPADVQEAPNVIVRATDVSGKPIAGAKATVDAELLNWSRSAVTDADGIASLRPLTYGGSSHAVTVEAEGYVPARASWPGDRPPIASLPVVLKRGAPLGGVVRDEQGKPIPGVEIYVNVNGDMAQLETHLAVPAIYHPGGNGPWLSGDTLLARTDENGRWRTAPAPLDLPRVQMMVLHHDYIHCQPHIFFNAVPPIESLRDGSAVITLRKGVRIAGTVTDERGAPLEDVLVGMEEGQWGYESPGRATDRQGRFVFSGMQPGYTALFFKRMGVSSYRAVVNAREGLLPIEVTLRPARKTVGRVVMLDGKPIPGARVRVHTWHAYHNPLNWHYFGAESNRGKLTDAEGRFVWDDTPDDLASFTITADGFLEQRNLPMLAGEREYVIPMTPAPVFSGSIVDAETGASVPYARVSLVRPSDDDLSVMVQDAETYAETGRFTLRARRHGAAPRLWIRAPGYEPFLSPSPTVYPGPTDAVWKLRRQATRTVSILTPEARPAAGAFAAFGLPIARVLLRDGLLVVQDANPEAYVLDYPLGVVEYIRPFVRPVEGSNRLSFGGWSAESTLRKERVLPADAEGRVRAPDLTPSDRVLICHESGWAAFDAGSLPEVVRLRPWGRIEGTLLAEGRPAAGRHVALCSGEEAPLSYEGHAVTDAQGRFAFDRVPAGEWHVHQALPGDYLDGYCRCAGVNVAEGISCRVTLGGTGVILRGSLRWPASLDLPADWSLAVVSLTPVGVPSDRHFSAAISPDGSFRAEDLPPGDYELRAVIYEPAGRRWRLTGLTLAGTAMPVSVGANPVELGVLTLNTPGHLKPGDEAPEIAGADLSGQALRLSSLRGQWVLLVFWSPSQTGLHMDAPMLAELQENQKGNARLRVLGVVVERVFAGPIVTTLGWDCAHLLPAPRSGRAVAFEYGVQEGIERPVCFLIDPAGRIAGTHLTAAEAGPAVNWKLGAGDR